MADRFGNFFNDKIVKLRNRLETTQKSKASTVQAECDNNSSTAPPTSPPPPLDSLRPTTPEEVRKIIMDAKATTCALDPIPTWFLKVIMNVLLPILTRIINLSFEHGIVPTELKRALIIPLLKKILLNPEILKNFRPVSNLAYLSKLIERVAAHRLLNHMLLNDLHELYQSSYKQFHSTETALLRIQSDILSALDNKKCVLLVLLDLSAAFDTIDHTTLISRLQNTIGVSEKALQWFISYMSDRTQSVVIQGVESDLCNLLFGVPQGSVLGPILFIIYTSPLGQIVRSLGIQYHFYADDTQLYISFDIDDATEAVTKMESAINSIRTWMANNFLCLNDDKTEVLLIGSKAVQEKLNIPHILIGNEKITPSKEAKNIGFIFDNIMNCHSQISAMTKSAWLQLRSIGKIRRYLNQHAAELLVHAFITSKLDINNSLLYGLPDSLIQRLQIIQNTAARLIMRVPKGSHITPYLITLHWLPIRQRICYKILLMVFKSLHGFAPSYITDMLQHKPKSGRSLRSDSQNLLLVPRARTVTYGDRNFKNVAPMMWNRLPDDIRLCEDIDIFKRLMKTHLFKIAYN